MLDARNFAAEIGYEAKETYTTYVDVGRAFPERAGTAASQIGAAQYFLGRYEQAIASYRHALDLGEDPDMMRENIVEAEEALRKRGGFR